MRLFLDTNVWVSAVLARGLCADLVRVLVTRHELQLSTMVISQPLRREFIRVMQEKMHAKDADLSEALELIDELSMAPNLEIAVHENIPDSEDVPILASALAGQADIFVTGDKPLLALGKVGGMELSTPRTVYEKLITRR